jgi:Cdc6-like AAA superfamily ATPase
VDREEYDRLYAATYPEGHSHNRESFWQFWHEIEVGDTIIARVGRKNIIGIGKVTKTVYYDKRQGETRVRDPHADVYANFIGVTWQEKPIKLAAIEFPIFPIWQIDAKKYLSYLMKVEEPPPPPPPPGAEPISPLLYKKKQIILYGPPGTGKTYSTRLLAVSLIGDYPSELPEYESEDNSKEESVLAIDNEIFSALDAQISSLNGVAIRTKPSMRCYYSLSTKGNRMKGLAWLEHPGKSGEFKVHLRKQNDGSFPEDMIAKVKDFNDNGWGGYPVFSVKEKQDVSPAMDLINFAYQNF